MTPLLACLLAAAILQFFGPEKVKFNFFFLTVPNRPSAVVGNLFKLRCPYPMVLLPPVEAGVNRIVSTGYPPCRKKRLMGRSSSPHVGGRVGGRLPGSLASLLVGLPGAWQGAGVRFREGPFLCVARGSRRIRRRLLGP